MVASFCGTTTVGTLTVNQNTTCGHATTTNITANKNLTLAQTGDALGGSSLHLRNRVNEVGAVFETTGVNLNDFIFKHPGGQRNIRLEGRGEHTAHGANTWQIGATLARQHSR